MPNQQIFVKNCCEWRNRTPSSPLWWSLLVKLLPGFMSEIVCLLCYRATITLTRNIIPHYRWRISHATLPISSNYELDNGLVASARFIMYTHLGAGSWIWTSDPRVTSQRQLLYISVSGNLHTLLYLAELYRHKNGDMGGPREFCYPLAIHLIFIFRILHHTLHFTSVVFSV